MKKELEKTFSFAVVLSLPIIFQLRMLHMTFVNDIRSFSEQDVHTAMKMRTSGEMPHMPCFSYFTKSFYLI